MIEQLTVFLENEKGSLAALCRCMADAGVNMSALSIAETTDYGLVRIICGDGEGAKAALADAGYHVTATEIVAVAVPDRPGGLAELLEALDRLDVNIEYGYCFSHQGDKAIMALRISDSAKAAKAVWTLEAAGFVSLDKGDI